jgi:hypothetical protein
LFISHKTLQAKAAERSALLLALRAAGIAATVTWQFSGANQGSGDGFREKQVQYI